MLTKSRTSGPYKTNTMIATYAPWIEDKAFREMYESIKQNTMVDEFRLYELWQLTKESAKLEKGSILEVGSWRGGSGAIIAKSAQKHGINTPVYICDTFEGIVKAGEKDPHFANSDINNTSDTIVKDLMHRLKLVNAKVFKGIFPDDTSHLIPSSEQFRFCHIDVDVYQSAKDIVEWLWPRLVDGGIIVFDDYGFESCPGITEYVNELRSRKDCTVIHNLNGHGIVIKRA